MKKLLAIALILLAGYTHKAIAQEKCISEIMFQEEAAKNPQMLIDRKLLEERVQQYLKNKKPASHRSSSATSPASYIIPVVVHVIHYGGPENISKAQILDQLRIMNEDFRRLNADTVNTPAAFRPLGGDSEIEFRLAQLDPQGNCTEGIVRVYSPLTTGARNNVKALSYWPSDKYLNMWVVASIANTNGSPGDVIGFAQFPSNLSTQPLTDGVVIRHDFFGSTGTAVSQQGMGRTVTHEVGHWLDLRHIWGDDGGLCSANSDDLVADTPPQGNMNLSTCPSFPALDNCSPASPGVMYPNYMDYTNGNCQNIFSLGQVDRMQTALGAVRTVIWSAGNLTATGTDGAPAVLCAPIADFIPKPRFVCEGATLTFNDASYGGAGTSRTWTFSGGTPATDTSANPVILYSTPGDYDVSLTITNAAGTNTKTVNGIIHVQPNAPSAPVVPFSEGFENGTFPFSDWYVLNHNGGAAWNVTTLAASTGTHSIYINNYNNNDKGPDEFITPAFDLSNVTATTMTFDVAFAYKDAASSNADKLNISASSNCGVSWTTRRILSGTTFPTTVNAVSFNFIPTSSTLWRNESVNFAPSSISTKPNVRFRFEFIHDTGNNIYIDNININGVISGVDEINAANASVNIYPNPSSSKTYVDFSTVTSSQVKIEVTDASGRLVSSFEDMMDAGDHQYTMNENLEKGMYLVRLTFGNSSVTKKVVIN